jgi:tetratricopeptide (TPR) repeat protein
MIQKQSAISQVPVCSLFLFSLCLLCLGGESPEPEKLLTEGHAAFARGDYEGAAALYERAEIHSTEPARVAYYLAGAKYHLALKTEGSSLELREAEQLYRCCLDPADPRRPEALYGLGNCLLHKAGTRDAASLHAAVACYDQCLQSAGDNEMLAANARYNREKARLMLLQFQPPPKGPQSDSSPRDDMNPQMPRHDLRHPMPVRIGEEGSDGNPDSGSIDGADKPEPGTASTKSNDPPAPGKGDMAPIPDEVDVPPLSAHDAAEHLELATKQVMRERQTHRRRGERPAATGVKDW